MSLRMAFTPLMVALTEVARPLKGVATPGVGVGVGVAPGVGVATGVGVGVGVTVPHRTRIKMAWNWLAARKVKSTG